jgi:hypothetical protein
MGCDWGWARFMELKITRLLFDETLYSVNVEYGTGTRPGVKAADLRRWLRELGVSEAAIAAVLAIAPHESITLEVADNFGSQRKAS